MDKIVEYKDLTLDEKIRYLLMDLEAEDDKRKLKWSPRRWSASILDLIVNELEAISETTSDKYTQDSPVIELREFFGKDWGKIKDGTLKTGEAQ